MADRYVLVSFKDTEDKSKSSRLRRYLGNAKMSFIFTSDPDEMKEYVDKIPTDPFEFARLAQERLQIEEVSCHAETTVSSNQEILERWARGTFSEDSSEMKLLFGQPPQPMVLDSEDDESNEGDSSPEDAEREMIDNNLAKLLPSNSVTSDHESSFAVQDETVHFCTLCNDYIDVGRTRNTKIKRQAGHVMFKHHSPEFVDFSVSRRYQCQRCLRCLPVQKSPCEHIGEYHPSDKLETDFVDLWSKPQLKAFNIVLEKCFGRQLPRPRSRRLRNGNSWVIHSKASYRIKQGDEVTKIDTLYEKDRMMRPVVAPQLEMSSSEHAAEDHEEEHKGLPEVHDELDDSEIIYLDDDEGML